MVSVYIACAQNSFYYFRAVVTSAAHGLLAVAVFLESSKMATADRIRGEIVSIVKDNDPLSRLHA